MSEGDRYEVHIGGSVTGSQVAAGREVTQTQSLVSPEAAARATPEDFAQQLAALRAAIERDVPPKHRERATQLVDEVEQEVAAGAPDPVALKHAENWFAKHAPKVLGAVTSVVVHPLVGRLVEAAGDALVAQFRALFGGSDAESAGR